MKIKHLFEMIIGCIGAMISELFGIGKGLLITLLILMLCDYVTGLICAGIFKKSKKSKSGSLNSRIGFKGLAKKAVILIIIITAKCFDNLLDVNYVAELTIIAYIINESISIIENAGLIGIPIPDFLKKSIDVLSEKNNEKENEK